MWSSAAVTLIYETSWNTQLPRSRRVEITEWWTSPWGALVSTWDPPLKCLQKLHPEGNTESIWTQNGSTVSPFPTQDIQTNIFPPLDHATKPSWRQGSLLDLSLSCEQSFRDLLGKKGRGYKDQDLAAWHWASSVTEPAHFSMALHSILNSSRIKWRCWQHLEVAKGKGRCSGILFGLVNSSLTSVTFSSFLSLALGHSSESWVKELALLCFSGHGY